MIKNKKIIIGKKIPDKYENPIDNKLYDIAGLLEPIFKYFNFTPNMITYLNIITSILSIYYLYYNNYTISCIFIFLTILLDCCDGYYARKNNMETHFGDLLDHYTDYIWYTILFYLIYFKINFTNKNIKIIIFILVITSTLHISCIEHYSIAKPEANTNLSKVRKMCINKNYIHYTKYFGPGTLHIFIIISLLFYTI